MEPQIWVGFRKEGLKFLEDPKYAVIKQQMETVFQTQKDLFVQSSPIVKAIRRDLVLGDSDKCDYEAVGDYVEEHLEDWSQTSVKELEWLYMWGGYYAMDCNGGWEATGIPGRPHTVKAIDMLLYYCIGRFDVLGLEGLNLLYSNNISYSSTFPGTASLKKKATRRRKKEVISKFLKDYPGELETFGTGGIPLHYREIASELRVDELCSYWRTHIAGPRDMRRFVKDCLREFKMQNGDILPLRGLDCLDIITRKDKDLHEGFILYEPIGIVNKIDKILEKKRFEKQMAEMQIAQDAGLLKEAKRLEMG